MEKQSWNVNDLELIQKIFHSMQRNVRLRYISLLSCPLVLGEFVFDFYWTRTPAFLIEFSKNEEIVFCFKKGGEQRARVTLYIWDWLMECLLVSLHQEWTLPCWAPLLISRRRHCLTSTRWPNSVNWTNSYPQPPPSLPPPQRRPKAAPPSISP